MENETLNDLLEEYSAQERINRLEGESGVQNLCRISQAIGYKDPQYFGQFQGACYGDLIKMLEDNPGACEALYNWIADQNIPEWMQNVESRLTQKPDDEENAD